jgi:hypothetical protein
MVKLYGFKFADQNPLKGHQDLRTGEAALYRDKQHAPTIQPKSREIIGTTIAKSLRRNHAATNDF